VTVGLPVAPTDRANDVMIRSSKKLGRQAMAKAIKPKARR
jgi:hypothetical protein